MRVRTDDRRTTDAARAGDDGPRLDPRIRLDLHARVDERARRVDDRHPGAHVTIVDVVAQAPLGGRERDAVVDAVRQLGIRRVDDRHPSPGADRERHEIGQVVLARPRGRHLAEVGAQPCRVEAVGAHVHLVDAEGGRVRVAMLDDGGRVAVRIADDAAVAGRIGEVRGEQGDRSLALRLLAEQGLEEVGGDERRIAHRDEHVTRRGRHPGQPDPHRVRGPQLGLLPHGDRGAVDRGLDLRAAVAGHQHAVLDAGRRQRVEDVADHRTPGKRVKDLGKR